ncbi:MAG: PAS domain S-box protein [Promethearchaeota archaeon]
MSGIHNKENIFGEKNDVKQNVKCLVQFWSDLETLISTISSRFFGDIEINDIINATLRDIGFLNKASRVVLYIINFNEINLKNTYEWCAKGIKPLFEYFNNSWLLKFPWWNNQLRKGKIINIYDISSLTDEAKATKRLLNLNNIRSLLVFPLYIRKDLAGFIGYLNDSIHKESNETQLSILRLSSQIIGNGIEHYIIKKMLKESEEKHIRIEENINDLIIILSLKLIVKYFNEKIAFKLLGYKKKEILEKSYLDFLHPKDKGKISKLLKDPLKSEKSTIKLRIKHKEGHWLWHECNFKNFINKDGQVRILVISRDITDQIFVEKRYKDLFDNSPNAILIINFNGIVVDANFTTDKIFGYERDYFIQKSIDELINFFPFEVKLYFKKIFHANFENNFPKPVEVELKKQDGESIWVEIQASIIKQKPGTLFQLIFKDITEKKTSELLEEKFKDELEQKVQDRTKELNKTLEQQKLYMDQIVKSSQFKTEFMATMSHELRTPLNAIIGFSDLLLEGVYGQINDEQKEFVTDIKNSAEHQFDMIKHILDISKIESGQINLNIQKVSLNNIFEQIKSSLKPMYNRKNLKLKIKGLDEKKYIYADPIRFKEILLNLLSNAIKFTLEGQITVKIQEKYGQWVFKVNDTGIGIDQKDFSLIFKEFKRVDSTYVRSVPGTGLGLSLTKRLVELHGGSITFNSVLGTGSTFTFTITKKLKEKIES